MEPVLHREGQLVGDALLRRHVGDFLRRAGAQVDNGVLGQLHGGPAGQNLLGVQGNGGGWRPRECGTRR